MTTPEFFLTYPRKQIRALHRKGCKATRARKRSQISATEAVWKPDRFLRDLIRGSWMLETECSCLTGQWQAEARAAVWLGLLHEDHEYLINQRAGQEQHQKRMARMNEWRAQFEGLRMACEVVWGQPVTWDTYTHNGNLGLRLGDPDWRDVGTIYVTVVEGGHSAEYAGHNLSSAATRTPNRIHALSKVLHLITMWRSPVAFTVPDDAPDFWRSA